MVYLNFVSKKSRRQFISKCVASVGHNYVTMPKANLFFMNHLFWGDVWNYVQVSDILCVFNALMSIYVYGK